MARELTDVPLIAKIEKQQALERLDAIVASADAIMVARGDLGVEIPIERVPATQKRVIRAANRAGCPVITATQMLVSMVTSPLPTRAEVTDVANAVLDGTDAVMLSAESASGMYPVETVAAMNRICVEAEKSQTVTLDRDFLVDGLVPDGVRTPASMKVVAVRPDGSVAPLVWLYEYDPRFRHAFLFRKPVNLPRGTIIRGVRAPARITLLPVEPGQVPAGKSGG